MEGCEDGVGGGVGEEVEDGGWDEERGVGVGVEDVVGEDVGVVDGVVGVLVEGDGEGVGDGRGGGCGLLWEEG